MYLATVTRSFWLLAALILSMPAVVAQGDPHAGHPTVGWIPREILERPVPLREGIGRVHDTVTTSSRKAPAFYDQGLAYLHSYVWMEAARSFNQALRDDPNLAMSYLGLSYAYSGLEDNEAARAMSAKARSLASRASEAERELDRITGTGPLAVTPEMIRPYINALRGEILLRSGQHDEGARILKEIQRKIRAVPGADAWIQALFRLESIARTARDTGNWELAEYTAKQMHSHDPSYAGTHYALAFVAKHRGENERARSEFAAAARLWGSADADLPELQHARQELKGL